MTEHAGPGTPACTCEICRACHSILALHSLAGEGDPCLCRLCVRAWQFLKCPTPMRIEKEVRRE